MIDRYSRQENFFGMGTLGQKKVAKTRIALVGVGALGSISAQILARGGIGFLRIIDDDKVEFCNLQRQILYDEGDVKQGESKVKAAIDRIKKINSSIEVEGIEAKINFKNNMELLKDVDLVIDGTDNFKARFAIDKACKELHIPWIYGGAIESRGMVMVMEVNGPCLGCITGEKNGENVCTKKADTVGVINSLPPIVASLQCTEAFKMITGNGQIEKGLLSFDIWNMTIKHVEFTKDENCPICGKNRENSRG